ncbi:hypothetical protein M422DRAFT_266368 [Sphaerobolus stellatus SS14]|uniref:Uncharacterized protein n=1 Tax=Sphaerobolus stellatus (strain SS14) TaxID=990650 RepID=A0A0C9UBB3_SPHS4|nr:hypothetical protein M422DRAFT_266368 [Sphaerobolus stellatus SS14]
MAGPSYGDLFNWQAQQPDRFQYHYEEDNQGLLPQPQYSNVFEGHMAIAAKQAYHDAFAMVAAGQAGNGVQTASTPQHQDGNLETGSQFGLEASGSPGYMAYTSFTPSPKSFDGLTMPHIIS